MKRVALLAIAALLAAGPAQPLTAADALPSDDAAATPPDGDLAPPPAPPLPPSLSGSARGQLKNTLDGRRSEASPGQVILAAETLFVVNSYLASIAPRIYGGAGLILLPAGLIGMEPGPERAASFILVESLALYNLLGVDTSDMSEGEIFRNNFAAWHGILVLNAIVHHAVSRRAANRKKVVFVPLRKGAAVQTAWRF